MPPGFGTGGLPLPGEENDVPAADSGILNFDESLRTE
jgi:hypothetical protein